MSNPIKLNVLSGDSDCHSAEVVPSDWYSIFQTLDQDNDGLLSMEDLRRQIHESAPSMGLTEQEADSMLYYADQNGDGFYTFGEFSSLMARAKQLYMKRLLIASTRSVLPKRRQLEPIRYVLEYSCIPPPLFFPTLTVLIVGIYFYYAIDSGAPFSPTGPVPINSIFILNPHLKAQAWRFFTYMFIHIGYIHLVSNVVVQILLGIPLEIVHKWARIMALYILGVFTGSVLAMACDPNIYLGGASGGVYTMLTAHVSDMVLNWDEMEFHWIRASIFGVLISTDVGVAVYQRYFASSLNKVSYMSHIGGAVAGLLLGVVLLRNLKLKDWEVYAWWICLVSYVMIITIAIIVIYAPALFH